jgi:hypothetical protein
MGPATMPPRFVEDSRTKEESIPCCSIRYILGMLYFCNQRPGTAFDSLEIFKPNFNSGIFVAPYLLARGWEEHNIGIVLFISGLIGLVTSID